MLTAFADLAAAQEAPGRIVATVTTLEGTIRMAGIDIELRSVGDGIVIARTKSDGTGRVEFPDVPPGRYVLASSQPGYVSKQTAEFDVRAGQTTEVLIDIQLEFELPEITVRADLPSPTDSVQPVSVSDMLSGDILESAPLEGDDFQSLLPLLPGVVRGSDGRLRIRGGEPTQGALQVSAASLIDPSTGDFDLQLPGQSIDSVEVLANPFAAEYGRFSSSITQIRTRRGTNEWEISPGNLMPRFKGLFTKVRGFEPRLSIRGPLKRDRVFMSVDTQFRYVLTPVKSLPDEPEIKLTSFDSFARFDFVLNANHSLGAGLVAFPREVANVTMNTFRPEPASPDFNQGGVSTGFVDRYAPFPNVVVESTVSIRRFEVDVNGDGDVPMVYSPETQSGTFFNDHDRDVSSFQWVEALSLTRNAKGQHVFKMGADLQLSSYQGTSFTRPVEVRRLDGSLAELNTFAPATEQNVDGYELAMFVQDRWRMGERVTLEAGLRFDRDAIVKHVNWSPRAGLAVSILPEGRGILRGGYGKFVQRTPLNVEAFPSFERRTVTRFDVSGGIIGAPILYANVVGELRTPEAYVGNVEWDQRFGRRILSKVAFIQRVGSHDYVLTPAPELAEFRLGSTGESRYKELEWTTRYLGGSRRDLTVSYVWSKATADLNGYDQFFGNFRNPIIRTNEHNLTNTDVRHRVLVRGNIGLPGGWDFAPVLELRSGFPWSAVDDYLDFVGPRNRGGRLPSVKNLDFQLARRWQFKKYRFRAGLKVYNIFGAAASRDVQNHLSSPSFGQFFNPIERSVSIVLGSAK